MTEDTRNEDQEPVVQSTEPLATAPYVDPKDIPVATGYNPEADPYVLDDRTPRDSETREMEKAYDDWVPPSLLPQPNPQPGWAFRYIRTSSRGAFDNTNVSRQFRQGWVPVTKNDHPEISVPNDVGTNFPDSIEIGGCLLCKIPEEALAKRQAYYERMASNQMRVGDEKLRQAERGDRSNMRIAENTRRSVMSGRSNFGK